MNFSIQLLVRESADISKVVGTLKAINTHLEPYEMCCSTCHCPLTFDNSVDLESLDCTHYHKLAKPTCCHNLLCTLQRQEGNIDCTLQGCYKAKIEILHIKVSLPLYWLSIKISSWCPYEMANQKGSSPYSKETVAAPFSVGIEQELLDADIILPSILPFKQLQMSEKYPKGHSRGRHWKHLKQILQAESYHLYPADEPNYLNVESPPSMYPAKKYCDITGFVAPYTDPRTKLRYANIDVFKRVRYLSHDHIQGYLGLRNAAVVLK